MATDRPIRISGDAGRALLAEIADLREEITKQGVLLADIDAALAAIHSEMYHANRHLTAPPMWRNQE